MIVTIDGPAGAGKSSIARQIAKRLDFEFLDTGALYRSLTLGVIQASIDLNDSDSIIQFAVSAEVRWQNMRVFLNGDDVTEEIRTPTVTDAIQYVADLPQVRARLSSLQRQIAAGHNIVTEGRDQGTEVFPNAECKIFLTASPDERARRRQQQLADSGRFMTIDEIRKAQDLRDRQDQTREIGALCPAADAIVIFSDSMTPDQVIDQILKIVDSLR